MGWWLALRKPCLACTRRYSSKAGTSKEPFKILFLGSDEFSIASLKAVIAAPELWSSIRVVTSPEKPVGRGKKAVLVKPPLQAFAQSHAIETHSIPIQGIEEWVPPAPFHTLSQTHFLITASFGSILPSSLLDLFPSHQKLNVHPSLLPSLRGAAPIQWTIANGLKETGVSVQEVGKGVDAGDILGVANGIIVEPDDTYHSLLHRVATAGAETLVKVLKDIQNDEVKVQPQDPAKVTKAPKIRRETAKVDFSSQTAEEIERLHRAFGHQHALWTEMEGQEVTLSSLSLPSSPAPSQTNGEAGTYKLYKTKPKPLLMVTCKDSSQLQITRLKVSGRKEVDASDWYNGLRR